MSDEIELSPQAKQYIEEQLRTRVNRTISIFGVVLGIAFGIMGFWTTQQTPLVINDIVIDQLERRLRVSSAEIEKIEDLINEKTSELAINVGQSRAYADELRASFAKASEEVAVYLLNSEDFAATIRNAVKSAPTEGLLSKAEFERQNQKFIRNAEELKKEVQGLKRIYDALDVNNTERALAVWDLRKDLNKLSSDLKALQLRTDKQLLKIDASIKAETTRIYDLGKWFFAIILAASIAPLLERFFTYRKKESIDSDASENDKEKNKPNKGN